MTASPESQTTLHGAARSGDQKGLRCLLAAGAHPNETDTEGRGALHLASLNAHPLAVRTLLEWGADPNMVDGNGQTPLHLAVENSFRIVDHLLSSGASVDVTDEAGHTPVQRARREFQVLLAARENLSSAARKLLTVSDHPEVRGEIAERPDAPERLIDLLVRAGSRPDLHGTLDEAPGPISSEERTRLREAGPFGKRLVAGHPDTPAEVLSTLSESPREAVLRAVARNPNLPIGLVWEMAAEVPEALLQNPARDTWEIANPSFLQGASDEALALILAQKGVPPRWLQEGVERGHSVRRAVATSNSSLPPEISNTLAGAERKEIRRALAQNPNVPAGTLHQLADDAAAGVREAVATNPSAPERALRHLVGDDSEPVRTAAANHPRAPGELISLLVRAGSQTDLAGRAEEGPAPITYAERERLLRTDYGKKLVAAHPGMPADVLERLIRDYPETVASNPSASKRLLKRLSNAHPARFWGAKEAVASNPSAPEELLRQLAQEVPEEVASNPSSPSDLVRELAGHENPRVREAALSSQAAPDQASRAPN